MHLLAEVGEPPPRIPGRVFPHQVGKDLLERAVAIVERLEPEEFRKQRPRLTFGDPEREEDQERVVPGLLDDNPALPEVLRDDACRYPPVLHAPARPYPGGEDGHLDGVEHRVSFFDAGKPVPGIVRIQEPAAGVIPEKQVIRIPKRPLCLLVHDTVRLPDGEPPVVLLGKGACPDLLCHRHHLLPKHDCLLNRLLDEELPRVPGHHPGCDVEGGDDGVLRGGGGEHHERLVEPGVVDGSFALPDVEHRALREGGEDLMG